MDYEKYLRIMLPFLGAIVFTIGIILTFFGARVLFQTVAICFALFVTGILFVMSYNVFLPHDSVPILISFLFLCSVVAGYISYQCYSFAKNWAVSLISAWGGLALGLMLIKLTWIKNATLTLASGIGGGVFGAYLGKKLNLLVRCSVTAFFGSFLIVKGLNIYFGGLPQSFSDKPLLKQEWPFYLYSFGFLFFFY